MQNETTNHPHILFIDDSLSAHARVTNAFSATHAKLERGPSGALQLRYHAADRWQPPRRLPDYNARRLADQLEAMVTDEASSVS